MALIDRLARLFQADLHAVLDRMEEPETLLKHAVREMEAELAACERRIRSLEQEREQLSQRRSGIEQSLLRVDEELDICFDSKNEELARTLVRRRLEAQLLLRAIEGRGEALEKTLREQRAALLENRAQFESLRQKSELLSSGSSEGNTDDGGPFAQSAPGFRVQDADVEIALLREKQRRVRKSQPMPSSGE
jgi:phage shock protein A